MRPIKVLIVEDEALASMSLAQILSGYGYSVGGLAGSGPEAIELIERELPDLILMDIYLDGEMDGIEASRRIWDRKQIPIIYLSALADEATIQEAKHTTHYGYILKPYTPNMVHIAIQVALERFAKDRELLTARRLLIDYAKRIEIVREEEQSRISRDIHDILGQKLTALQMDGSWLKKRIADCKPELLDRLDSMHELLRDIVAAVKDLAAATRPTAVLESGLNQAIRREAELFSFRGGVPCDVRLPAVEAGLDKPEALMLFRIFQEALTNIARHAKASRVLIVLEETETGTVLKIEDNGVGIPDRLLADPKSIGLLGMRERAAALNGKLTILSQEGKSTSVTLTLPRRNGSYA